MVSLPLYTPKLFFWCLLDIVLKVVDFFSLANIESEAIECVQDLGLSLHVCPAFAPYLLK